MNPWILSKPPQENGERKVVGYDKTLLEVIKKLYQLTDFGRAEREIIW